MSSSNNLPEPNATAHDDLADGAISSDPSLEIDSEQSDERDSALGDSLSYYTMSATSSVFDFRYENGRRYHAYSEGKYPVPNDETEADRLDLQHHAFRLTLDGKLNRAPISKDIQNVLDVGCGTGIWTIEFADEYPSARVIGTDISPIQPVQVPPNCEFLIDDCEKDWIFREKFDYIHSRALVAAITNWDRFFEQAYNNLKPGGYLECQKLTFSIKCIDPGVTVENSPLLRWSQYLIEAASQIGIDGTRPYHFTPQMRRAGFVDINLKMYKWPVGRWAKGGKAKLLGRFVFEDLMDWLPSSALGMFTRVLKWSREEVEVFLSECRAEAKRKDRHFYGDVLFWYARKPLDADHPSSSGNDVIEVESIDRDEGEHGNITQGVSSGASSSTSSGAQASLSTNQRAPASQQDAESSTRNSAVPEFRT